MSDPLKTAKDIFNQFLSKADPSALPNYDPKAKDPQAQAAGRKGGLRGGFSRRKALSSKQRVEIARKAARVRWEGKAEH